MVSCIVSLSTDRHKLRDVDNLALRIHIALRRTGNFAGAGDTDAGSGATLHRQED